MSPGDFSWSAFDKNRCDYFYHNGQQCRFYRQQPPHLAAVPFEREELSMLDRLMQFFWRVAG